MPDTKTVSDFLLPQGPKLALVHQAATKLYDPRAYDQSNKIYLKPIHSPNRASKGQQSQAQVLALPGPNFVLLGNETRDILVVAQTQTIVEFTQRSRSLINKSKVVVICALSLLGQVLQSVAWQSYLLILSTGRVILSLPDQFSSLKNRFLGILEVLKDSQARAFWWLEAKLELRQYLAQANRILSQTMRILQRFYLTMVVFLCLGLLNVISLSAKEAIPTGDSVLSRLVNNHSLVRLDSAGLGSNQAKSAIAFAAVTVSSEKQEETNVQKILRHKTTGTETVEQLAEMYSLSTQTISYNNNLSIPLDQKIEADREVYLPWSNGYILNLTEETAPEDLAKKYSLDENLLKEQNKDFLSPESGKFAKDSLLLLPTTNFEEIKAKKDEEEKARKDKEEAEKERQKVLATAAVSANMISNKPSSSGGKSASGGFIWPTNGTISRCVQPGHVACDIANFSSPPIYSVQSGKVLEAGWKNGGYGYMALVDHGGGLKTIYMHMTEVYVSPGQTVEQGQSLGRMGCTGNCSGTHLHFEVWQNEVRQDPLAYLP